MRVDRIRKIKVLGEGKARLQLAWNHAEDEFDVKFCDEPRPELYEALAGLIPHILRLLELPSAYEDGLSCTGVSLTWKNDILGAVVTCQKKLQDADAPLILNTPHLPSEPYGEGAAGALLPEEIVEALYVCMNEAELYIQGERAQMDLFGGEEANKERDKAGVDADWQRRQALKKKVDHTLALAEQELEDKVADTLAETGVLR